MQQRKGKHKKERHGHYKVTPSDLRQTTNDKTIDITHCNFEK